MDKETEKQVYKLLMRYIEKKFPDIAARDSKKKYDLYLQLLSKMEQRYADYLRDYFIRYLNRAEDFDSKRDEELLKKLDEELEKL